MACGTGKTLVQLWSAERLGCRRVLVLVPSLALLRQTLHVWLRETGWPTLSYLAVCSDPTVKPDDDPLIVRQGDLDFPVTTDSETVQHFLAARPEGVQIIFSTYHSAPEVAKGLPNNQAFDLAIFDEAHWTAGREDQRFAFALADKHLCIKKRLFMTATPRHYNPQRRDKEGDPVLVYSMDRPETYGRRVYTLSFAEAARRDIICGYKVIISVVTSTMLNEELLQRGEVTVQGDPVKARQVANQIALRKAVEQIGVGKIITFHGKVRSAASFTSGDGEGIRTHLPDFQTYHVNGTMRAADRDGLMQEFREAPKAVMSNARCLTEGVDVPAVDMVAFLTPKRSRLDIVQATGRAMRKAEGKTTGYVFLPLFVQEAGGESIEEAIERTDFEEVWNVLQALQEQDEVLADTIREMRETHGRAAGFDDSRFRERVQIVGPAVSLDMLRQSITTRCVERLAASWDYVFGKLSAFKDRFTHCNVPQNWPEDPSLGFWVGFQRQLKKRGALSRNRMGRLDEIGFEWDTRTAKWEEMFTGLVQFRERFKHCEVPGGWEKDPRLSRWVLRQRQWRKQGRLASERIRRLDELGFQWGPYAAAWEEMFARLVQFRERFGHCNIPANWSEDSRLIFWVGFQRQLKKQGRLTDERIRHLVDLGFEWDILTAAWEEFFARLVEFKERFGHCRVAQAWPQDPQLGKWVARQRRVRTRGRLSADRVQRLGALGFEWDPLIAAQEEMFARLVQYKECVGNCNVPARWTDDPQLAHWVEVLRRNRKRGVLSDDRIQRLDALGFEWDPFASGWDEMMARLTQYKERLGGCTPTIEQDPQLSRWTVRQRGARKVGSLSADRIQRLEALGFEWDTLAAKWEEMLRRLLQFKKRFTHCLVPLAWSEDPKLGHWVSMQRRLKIQGKLSRERIGRLDELGFEWEGKF